MIVFIPELSDVEAVNAEDLVAIHTDSAELKEIFPKLKERLKFKKFVSIEEVRPCDLVLAPQWSSGRPELEAHSFVQRCHARACSIA